MSSWDVPVEEFLKVKKQRDYIERLCFDVPDNRLPELISFLEKFAVHSGPDERNVMRELEKSRIPGV